jgi:hypothetical protein
MVMGTNANSGDGSMFAYTTRGTSFGYGYAIIFGETTSTLYIGGYM